MAESKLKQLVELREKVKARNPKFIRYLSDRIKKISRSGYRRPKGRHNKMRLRIKGKPKMVNVGYGGPAKSRHIHPSGYFEVLVHNPKELESIDPKTQAVRIASSVGTKKRLEIIEKAKELGIKVLNPRIKRKAHKKLKEREERKKKEEQEKKKKKKVEEKKEEKVEKAKEEKTEEKKEKGKAKAKTKTTKKTEKTENKEKKKTGGKSKVSKGKGKKESKSKEKESSGGAEKS